MKFAAVFLLALLAVAQTPTTRSAVLTWADAINPSATTTYNVYRASGACPVTSLPAPALKTGIAAIPNGGGTYTDSTVTLGLWCYGVTAVIAGQESAQTMAAGGLLPASVSSLTITFVSK